MELALDEGLPLREATLRGLDVVEHEGIQPTDDDLFQRFVHTTEQPLVEDDVE